MSSLTGPWRCAARHDSGRRGGSKPLVRTIESMDRCRVASWADGNCSPGVVNRLRCGAIAPRISGPHGLWTCRPAGPARPADSGPRATRVRSTGSTLPPRAPDGRVPAAVPASKRSPHERSDDRRAEQQPAQRHRVDPQQLQAGRDQHHRERSPDDAARGPRGVPGAPARAAARGRAEPARPEPDDEPDQRESEMHEVPPGGAAAPGEVRQRGSRLPIGELE